MPRPGDIFVGGDPRIYGDHFPGTIDEVAVYVPSSARKTVTPFEVASAADTSGLILRRPSLDLAIAVIR